MDFTATYSPEDNKLRLYASAKLPKELYERVRGAGFIWAPKQELFVAPCWTPDREDICLELAGEIGDEDTSLVERAEERAERFEDYSESRAEEAERAHANVAEIADGIPLGQPILVGHHSERRARKDAERIENGMRKAVKAWETSKYWTDRAEGAIHAAKYKERPDVRHRRIKTIEVLHRKMNKSRDVSLMFIKHWSAAELTAEGARHIGNYDYSSKCFPLDDYPRDLPASQYEGSMSVSSALRDGIVTLEQAREICLRIHKASAAWADRWLTHCQNRLYYERAMVNEQGGIVAEKTLPEVGGAIRCIFSPGYGKGWSYIKKVNKVSVSIEDNWGNGGGNFKRTFPMDDIKALMTRAEVEAAGAAGRIHDTTTGFYLDEPAETRDEAKQRLHLAAVAAADQKNAKFDALKDTLKAGVVVVSAPQLFPTPSALAKELVRLAGIVGGERILEPSAGTGNLLKACLDATTGADCCRIVAVEINHTLAGQLESVRDKTLCANDENYKIICADFLERGTELGTFHRIVMNPPFKNGSDIKHIIHALTFLKPGGRLVAICVNGPRQQKRLKPLADEWIDLPPGSFESEGTGVNTAICVFNK